MNEQFIFDAIKARVREEIRKEIDTAINKAVEELARSMRAKADMLALDLLHEYDVSRHGTNIVITVKK